MAVAVGGGEMTIPDDLSEKLPPYGVWYYLRLREFLEVGQVGRLTFRKLRVNRMSGLRNNWLLQEFGFIKVKEGVGKRTGNTYKILR